MGNGPLMAQAWLMDVRGASAAEGHLEGDRLNDGLQGILGAFERPAGTDFDDLAEGLSLELRLIEPQSLVTDEPRAEQWMELSAFPVLGHEVEVSAPGGGTILVMRDVTSACNAATCATRSWASCRTSCGRREPRSTAAARCSPRRAGNVSEEERREVFEDIRAEADRLHRLVENLLVLSRVERQGLQIEPEPVLLQRLIPRVVEGESGRWPNAVFDVLLPAGLPPVAGEET